MADDSEIEIGEFRFEDMPRSCTWIIVGAPGSGKCLAKGTPILMYDGTINTVENIKENDLLMGDDSKPRKVLGTCRGVDQMYKITQDQGNDYIVNEPHILVLSKFKKGEFGSEVIEIPVYEYIDKYHQNDDFIFEGVKTGHEFSWEYRSTGRINVESLGLGDYYGFEITGNGRFLLGDFTVTHNTSFIENMCYSVKHLYPVARVMVGTETGYKRFKDIFHPLYVSNYYDEEEEKSHILRQRKCAMENPKGYDGNYAINILDDATDDPRVFHSGLIKSAVKLGSQHWNQLFLVGTQYAYEFPPVIRKSISYVAIGREPEQIERQKLFKNFGGIAGTFKRFNDLMDELTGDFTFLIIKKRSQSNNLEDCIFFYRTVDPVETYGNWKFGCKEYRKWAEDRYNKDYKEQIRI